MTDTDTDTPHDRALAYARTRGEQDGRNAVSWFDWMGGWSGPDPEKRAARAILAGIEDGDPAVLDTLPAADLSGQWADTLTGPQLVADAWIEAGITDWRSLTGEHDAAFTDICDAYETAFSQAVEDEIARAARAVLEGGE